MKKRMGKGNAAANRTDFCKTDFYFSNNSSGVGQGPNVKPSSATAVLKLDASGAQRAQALQNFQKVAGDELRVKDENGRITLSLPQENYQRRQSRVNTDRDRDAVDVVNRALSKVEKEAEKEGLGERLGAGRLLHLQKQARQQSRSSGSGDQQGDPGPARGRG
jgi:Arc/MetJ-type ribon-helix-helix transcriptional regulator